LKVYNSSIIIMKGIRSKLSWLAIVWITWIALCVPLISWGQNSYIDSLVISMNSSKDDTNKVLAIKGIIKYYWNLQELETATQYAEKMESISREIEYGPGIIAAIGYQAQSNLYQSNYIKAIILFRKEAETASKFGKTNLEGFALQRLAYIYTLKGLNDQALETYQKSYDLFLKSHSYDDQLTTILLIGNHYFAQADTLKAIQIFEEFLNLSKEESKETTITLVGLTMKNTLSINQGIGALPNIWHGIQLAKNLNDQSRLSNNYGIAGLIYFNAARFDSADYYLNQCMITSKANNITAINSPYLASISKLLALRGDYTKAIHLLDELETEVKRGPASWWNLNSVFETKLYIYKLKGDYKSLNKVLDKQLAARDSVKRHEIENKIATKEFDIQLQDAIMNNENLRLENEAQKRTKRFIIGTTSALSLCGILMVISLVGTIRRNRKLFKIQENHRKLVLESSALESESMMMQLEFKNKELATQALKLVQKTNVLREIKEALEKTKAAFENPESLNSIIKQINLTQKREEAWKEFRKFFEQANPGFFAALESRLEKISESELRLSALLRLNFSTKQCAETLGISSESVKMARYRFRKKLSLATEENLVSYLMSI